MALPTSHGSGDFDPAEEVTLPLGRKPASTTGATGDPLQWMPPTVEQLQAQLPGYRIEAFLARGGMGAVYRGLQLSLDRPVAIKVLPASVDALDPSFGERFHQEARAMAKLNFPGIVGVYDFGQMADGMRYLVMEYVEGTDVAALIARQGRLPADEALAITAHVCDALQYAHREGIVHRDIKPANIMVSTKGEVKVADFGLAKTIHAGAIGLTQSGMVMGTPHFMAPEALILGSAVDHRADIYAVGVMLYQMLTGRLPQGVFEMPSRQVPGLDPRFDGIVAAALREQAEHRYQDIGLMRSALDALLTQPVPQQQAPVSPEPTPAPSAPRRSAGGPARPSRPAPTAGSGGKGWLVAALGLLLAAGAFWWTRNAPTDPDAAPAAAAPTIAPAAPVASAPEALPEESLTDLTPGPWQDLFPTWHGYAKLLREPDGSGFLPNDPQRWTRFRSQALEFTPSPNRPLQTALTPGALVVLEGGFELETTLSHTGSDTQWTVLLPLGKRYLPVTVDFQRGEVTALPALAARVTPVPSLTQGGTQRLRLRLTPAPDRSGRFVLKVFLDDAPALHWCGQETDLPATKDSLTQIAHSLPMQVALAGGGSLGVSHLRLRALGGAVIVRTPPQVPVLADTPSPQPPPATPTAPAPPAVPATSDGPPWLDAIAAWNGLPALKREADGWASFASDTQKFLRFSPAAMVIEHRAAATAKTPLLAPPLTVLGGYELEATLQATGAASYWTLQVPVGARHLPLGISFERGEVVTQPSLQATTAPSAALKTPGPHRLRLQWQENGPLTVSLDGVQVLGWNGQETDLPVTTSVPGSLPMEFGFSAAGKVELTQLRLRGQVQLGAPTAKPATVAAAAATTPKPTPAPAAAPPPRPPFVVEGAWQDFIAGWYATPNLVRESDGYAYLPDKQRIGRFAQDHFEITYTQGQGVTPYILGFTTISGAHEWQAKLVITGNADAWHLSVPIGQRYLQLVIDFLGGQVHADPELKSKATRNRRSKRLGEHLFNLTVIPEAEGSPVMVVRARLDDEEVLHWTGQESDLSELPVKMSWADVPTPNVVPMGFGFSGAGQFRFNQIQVRSLGGTVTPIKTTPPAPPPPPPPNQYPPRQPRPRPRPPRRLPSSPPATARRAPHLAASSRVAGRFHRHAPAPPRPAPAARSPRSAGLRRDAEHPLPHGR